MHFDVLKPWKIYDCSPVAFMGCLISSVHKMNALPYLNLSMNNFYCLHNYIKNYIEKQFFIVRLRISPNNKHNNLNFKVDFLSWFYKGIQHILLKQSTLTHVILYHTGSGRCMFIFLKRPQHWSLFTLSTDHASGTKYFLLI